MTEVGCLLPPFAHGGEDLLEVQLLARVRHINDLIRMPLVDPVFQCRHIGRAVQKRAIGFLDDQWRGGLEFRIVLEEDANRALALPGDAEPLQFFDRILQHRIIKALAEYVIE